VRTVLLLALIFGCTRENPFWEPPTPVVNHSFDGGGTTTSGGPATDVHCAQNSHSACIECCISLHPAGNDHFVALSQQCLCVDPGACSLGCGDDGDFCHTGKVNSINCEICIENNGCDNSITDCRASADCAAYLDCAMGCPAS
jgi:hypothetical protein